MAKTPTTAAEAPKSDAPAIPPQMAEAPTTAAEVPKGGASAFQPRFIVVVHSRAADGFRRGGKAFPAGRSEHPVDDFNADQIAAILAEPLLSVEVAEVSAAAILGADTPEGGQ